MEGSGRRSGARVTGPTSRVKPGARSLRPSGVTVVEDSKTTTKQQRFKEQRRRLEAPGATWCPNETRGQAGSEKTHRGGFGGNRARRGKRDGCRTHRPRLRVPGVPPVSEDSPSLSSPLAGVVIETSFTPKRKISLGYRSGYIVWRLTAKKSSFTEPPTSGAAKATATVEDN